MEADQAAYAEKTERHVCGDFAPGQEVDGGEDEGEPHDAPPESVAPFHEVDLLEFFECHVGVQELEFGRGAVFLEFRVPVARREGRQGACYRLPFCDAEAGDC